MSKAHTTPQLELAKRIAFVAHAGQFRRDGETPYIVHPASVARRVKNTQTRFEGFTMAVAWLHDSIEDSGGMIHVDWLLHQGVEAEIVESVIAMTKAKGEDYEDYLNRVKLNRHARIVKVQDMLDNLASNPTDRQILKYAKGLQFLLS